MTLEEFEIKIKPYFNELEVELSKKQIEQFYTYMNLLLEWNNKINLTAITDEEEIIIKHFVDSITISKYIPLKSKIMDIGTGAGFPGIPLRIIREDVDIILADSLQKRIKFLNTIIEELKLVNIEAIHGRAEELSRNKIYREKFDIITSRAVANLSTLSEYMLPFVKVGGKAICMKGALIEEELTNAEKAIKVLGGKVENIDGFLLPKTDMKRNVIILKKISSTPNKYPRKPGTPAKEPIK